MPTTRPRHQITETPDIAAALDIAAQRWPNESRSKLLVRLVRTGGAFLEREHRGTETAQARAIDATSGKYGGLFGRDFLADLRRDWPE